MHLFKPFQRLSNPLADLPLIPEGAVSFNEKFCSEAVSRLSALLSAVLTFSGDQAKNHTTFLLGISEQQALSAFPSVKTFSVSDVLDDFELSPSTYSLVLRMLFGESTLIDHHHDLLLLEMLGLHTPKPIALPFLTEWVEEQLSPKNIARCLSHPMTDERVTGAALKALMMHPSFTFEMLDHLPSVAQRVSSSDDLQFFTDQPGLKKAVKDAFRDWSSHSRVVVRMVRKIVASPPPELFFLAQMQRCIGEGGVWRLPDDLALHVAKGLHVFGMANGLRQRNHWVIDTASPIFTSDVEEIKRSLERFGYQLWQETQARQNGYGPALWVNWLGAPAGVAARRMLDATQAALCCWDDLEPLIAEMGEQRGLETSTPGDNDLDRQALGVYETAHGSFRLLSRRESSALAKACE